MGPVRDSVEYLLAESPAELDLVTRLHQGIVLLAADDLRVLGAGHDAMELDGLIAGVQYIRRPVHIERVRRAELRRNVLRRAGLIQAVQPVDGRARGDCLDEKGGRETVRPA